ncbi:hypothetical protein MXE38_04775 [Anaerobiospirillum sp. NML120448]|uniref:hypothetical protein n=1 Tax=Anaerobiospirillum sp. NML120448 TaxID=2932816 RepID=UPI001FF2C7AC|nr:hypothetical protein [Anaerobiospirillum sp. NML120448]MCK0514180.1 hypothetical protein [Anaerobiospirillum sp. NML120448]
MEPNDLSQLLPSYRVFTIEELKNGSYEHKAPDYQIYDVVIEKSFKSLNEAFETQCIKFGKPYTPHQQPKSTSAAKLKSPKESLPQNAHSQEAQDVLDAQDAPVAPKMSAVPAPGAPALDQTQVIALQTKQVQEQKQELSLEPANSPISDEAIMDYDFGYSDEEASPAINEQEMPQSLGHNGLNEPEPRQSSDLDEFDLTSLVSLIDDYNQHHSKDSPVYEAEAEQEPESGYEPELETGAEVKVETPIVSPVTTDSNNELNLPFGEPSLMPDSPFKVSQPPEAVASDAAAVNAADTVAATAAYGGTRSQELAEGMEIDGNAALANIVSSLLAPLHCEAQFDNELVNHKRFRVTLPSGNDYLLLIYHKQNNNISKIAFNKRLVEDNGLLQHIIELLEQNLLHRTINNGSTPTLNIESEVKANISPKQSLDSAQGKGQEINRGAVALSGPSPWSEAILEEESKALQYGVVIQKYSPDNTRGDLLVKPTYATNSGYMQGLLPEGNMPVGNQAVGAMHDGNLLAGAMPAIMNPTAHKSDDAMPWGGKIESSKTQVNGAQDGSIDDRVSRILVPLGFEVKFLQDASYQRQYEVKTHSGESCILMIYYKGNNTISNIRFNKTPQADKVNLAMAAVELNKQLLKTKIW